MEEAVGVPLLARQRLGVLPTEAGHTLLRHARSTLASMQRLTDDPASSRTDSRARCGCSRTPTH
jgi:DNA-binding transcriptional LysR family regulator